MTYIQRNQHILIGIHSRSTGHEEQKWDRIDIACGEKSFATRVTSLLDWIDTTLNKNPNEPPVFCSHGKNAADP